MAAGLCKIPLHLPTLYWVQNNNGKTPGHSRIQDTEIKTKERQDFLKEGLHRKI
jgi:hypothetical protein